MVAYVVAERLEEWDGSVFSDYRALAAASIALFGGRYLALTDKAVTLEGCGGDPLAMALIEFPDLKQAQAWYDSKEYQAAAVIRRRGARNRFVVVESPALR